MQYDLHVRSTWVNHQDEWLQPEYFPPLKTDKICQKGFLRTISFLYGHYSKVATFSKSELGRIYFRKQIRVQKVFLKNNTRLYALQSKHTIAKKCRQIFLKRKLEIWDGELNEPLGIFRFWFNNGGWVGYINCIYD